MSDECLVFSTWTLFACQLLTSNVLILLHHPIEFKKHILPYRPQKRTRLCQIPKAKRSLCSMVLWGVITTLAFVDNLLTGIHCTFNAVSNDIDFMEIASQIPRLGDLHCDTAVDYICSYFLKQCACFHLISLTVDRDHINMLCSHLSNHQNILLSYCFMCATNMVAHLQNDIRGASYYSFCYVTAHMCLE